MKKCLIVGMCAAMVFGPASAAVKYTETETVVTVERVSANRGGCAKRFASSRDVRPCAHKAVAKPVRVKTHTEVIDHYQVYQPVTVYQPMGVQVERRIVPVKSCNKCGF
ncbi:MAG: hypothetical protein IKL37_00510 [Alphaproteobacteria bacterium]|nr:hypothetical protein [Alphaproteobacteria bacterium]MBR6684728.1 hypothetical protein [Alphaproteobacteria bacterium]